MGKIKSAILTAVLVCGIVVLAFFATVSYTVPGTGGVNKNNSFISSISLGSEFTGEACAVLYPEGVISDADYKFGIPEDETSDKYKEYTDKYVNFGSLWVDKEVLGEDGKSDKLRSDVKHDAEMLSKRLENKGYASYSVSVKDDLTISVSVPTYFTYSEYSDEEYGSSARSDKQSAISNTLSYLAYGGELTLRNSEVGVGHDKILTPITADVASYFKSFEKFTRAGNTAVKVELTDEGETLFNEISAKVSAATNDKAVGFYIGDNQLIPLTLNEDVTGDTFYISTNSEGVAQDYAIVLSSVLEGETLLLDYGTATDIDVIYTSAPLGVLSAIFLGCTLLVAVLAVIVYSVIRYRLLGLVNSITVIIYTLTMIVALMLIEIPFTVAGAVFALAGLMLLCGANFAAFEKVRKETEKGKTIYSAVKSGYKGLLKGILELHIVLIAVSLIFALVGVGTVSACGLIFFIASIASYLLHWFTRFMWYVLSSTVRDKFAFCGFKREELEDD